MLTIKQQDTYAYHNPPTPRSAATSDGIRTRSGRSTKRNDSPFSTTKSGRVSKSPAPRRREKKSKIDKTKMPKLTEPLSVLTKDMSVSLKDIEAWVNRSTEVRKQEVEKRNGYITRPMNSFMLYRSAYADRTKQWCLQNNHQVVSSVSGESWPMELPEVREQYNKWAKLERANHAAAHPDYKFSPSKSSSKKRRGNDTDEDSIDLDDPDAEYRGPRNGRRRGRTQEPDVTYLPSNTGYDAVPYFGHPVTYEVTGYPAGGSNRPLPTNVSHEHAVMQYNPQYNAYTHLAVQTPVNYQTALEALPRAATPHTLGGYGLPAAAANEEFFLEPRHDTPIHAYNQYAQQLYAYPGQRVPAGYAIQNQLALEQQQYLQAQTQATTGIDPGLEMPLTAQYNGGMHDYHFDNAFNGYTDDYVYAEQANTVDATLAPSWSPTEALK